MAAQVNVFCFLMYFSAWLVIWSLKIGTFVLIKVFLTNLLKIEINNVNSPNFDYTQGAQIAQFALYYAFIIGLIWLNWFTIEVRCLS